MTKHPPPKSLLQGKYSTDWLIEGVLQADRMRLSKAITMIESRAQKHRSVAHEILTACLPHEGKAHHIGITGVPGAGKSTFIESFGLRLCRKGFKVAVLAVDPSSSRTGGSILGDKTRMEELSRHPNSFIRPTPSSGTLGGVAARTRETMILLDAAGYDWILVETVGVGQSEIDVRSMVDFFLLLQIAGAGDELQGMKKGVVELADAIVVNKADGDNVARARRARSEYGRILTFLDPYTPDWQPKAVTCSALEGNGLGRIETMILDFIYRMGASGTLEKQRKAQRVQWFRSLLRESVYLHFLQKEGMRESIGQMEEKVRKQLIPVTTAIEELWSS